MLGTTVPDVAVLTAFPAGSKSRIPMSCLIQRRTGLAHPHGKTTLHTEIGLKGSEDLPGFGIPYLPLIGLVFGKGDSCLGFFLYLTVKQFIHQDQESLKVTYSLP